MEPIIQQDESVYFVPTDEMELIEVKQTENGTFHCEQCANLPWKVNGDCEHIQTVQSQLIQPNMANPQDIADADRILQIIAKFDCQLSEINTGAKEMITRIEDWQRARIEPIEKQKQFYCNLLRSYLVQKDRKTEKLPTGTIQLRKMPDEIVIDDSEAVMLAGFKRETVKYSVDKTKLRNHIKQTGEIPDGADVLPQEPRFNYQLTSSNQKAVLI